MGTFANSEDPDEMQHKLMLHFIRVYTVMVRRSLDKRIQYFLKIITCHHLICTMDYPKLLYQIRRKNPFVYKGLTSKTTFETILCQLLSSHANVLSTLNKFDRSKNKLCAKPQSDPICAKNMQVAFHL